MKILIVKTAFGEIDIFNAAYNYQEVGLARALVQAGEQCDIMCCADDEPSIKMIDLSEGKHITLYCMKAAKILKNSFFYHADDIIKSYDMLQASEYNQMYTWHMAKKYRKKIVIYHGPYHCAFNKRYNLMSEIFDHLFLKRYLRLNTCFITKSRLAENYLRDKGIKNVRTIGVGIDIEVLSSTINTPLDFVSEIRQHDCKKVMYVGRIEPRRNVLFLLDILQELNKKQEVALILVGSGDKRYVRSFFETAKEKGVYDKILYKEKIEQRYMEQLYDCADIFLFPTIYDIFGMVLLEAMYFKQCVLTTVNGGSDMLVQDGDNGYIMESFDVLKWTSLIERLFVEGSTRNIMGIKANKMIREHFTWQVLAGRFLDSYVWSKSNAHL